jgi:hypothetical protein
MFARRRCGLTLRQLGAKAGGLTDLAVSKALTRVDARMKADRVFRALRDQAEAGMSSV